MMRIESLYFATAFRRLNSRQVKSHPNLDSFGNIIKGVDLG